MGGCNSSFTSFIANNPIGSSAFGLPLLDGLSALKPAACDKSPQSLIRATNNIVSVAIAKSISNCFVNQVAQQNTRIKCRPKLPEGVTVYEENLACGQCIENTLLDFQQQNALEQAMWANSPATVRQPIDQYYSSLIQSLESCGLSYCKACVLTNITQMNIVQSNATCISTFMNRTNIQANISNLLQQQFLNNQDILSGAAQTLGNSNLLSLSDQIASNLMTVVNDDFIQDLQATLESSQVIELISDTTVKLSNVSQSSITTVTQSFVDDNNVATNTFSQEIFDAISQISNQQTTLDSVGKAIFQSSVTFVSAISSSVGIVMFATIGVLLFVVVVIISYLVYRKIQESAAQKKIMLPT